MLKYLVSSNLAAAIAAFIGLLGQSNLSTAAIVGGDENQIPDICKVYGVLADYLKIDMTAAEQFRGNVNLMEQFGSNARCYIDADYPLGSELYMRISSILNFVEGNKTAGCLQQMQTDFISSIRLDYVIEGGKNTYTVRSANGSALERASESIAFIQDLMSKSDDEFLKTAPEIALSRCKD